MNEKNKNEKTFGDIFSNINNKEEKNKSINFNEILEKTSDKNDETESVTMETLFNKTITNENDSSKTENIPNNQESKIDLNTLNNLVSTKSNIFDTQNESEETTTISEPKLDNNSNIFGIPNEEKESEETTIDSEPKPDNNPNIFGIPNEEESEETTIDSEPKLDNKTNIFGIQNEEKESEEITIDSEPKLDNKTNIFGIPNEEEETEETTIVSEPKLDNNPNIFGIPNEEESEEKVQKKEINSYPSIDFDKSSNNDNQNIFLENNTSENNNPFFEDEETEKSTSPFFEDNISEEKTENPFFDNKINLIESEKHNIGNPLSKINTSTVKNFDVKIVKKKEPLIKFIIGVLSYAVFIWLLLIGITLILYIADIKIRAAKGDYSTPKYNAYVVLTGSMLPEIQVYDVVITKKTEAQDLKEGDVITFSSSDTRFLNTIITHRIIKKNYDAEKKSYTFQTKGDNNNVADSALVQPNNIYGKVILKVPKLGYLQHFLAQDGGYILVVIVPCLIVISYDIVKLIKGLKRKKYKNIKVQK